MTRHRTRHHAGFELECGHPTVSVLQTPSDMQAVRCSMLDNRDHVTLEYIDCHLAEVQAVQSE